MRLIDADVAKRWMLQNEAVIDIAILKAIPTVDAVPVVRCKNCEYFGVNDENVPYCVNPFGLDDPKPNGFCNYGRKKNVD